MRGKERRAFIGSENIKLKTNIESVITALIPQKLYSSYLLQWAALDNISYQVNIFPIKQQQLSLEFRQMTNVTTATNWYYTNEGYGRNTWQIIRTCETSKITNCC